MLTTMTESEWAIVLQVFRASRSRRGDKGRDDRKFLEALQYFAVHNITWRALPRRFGHWNSVWKRFWRLSQSGTFEAFFDALAAMSETAHLVQMFDSTVVRAYVSAAGAKGGKRIRRSAARAAASRRKSTSRSISTVCPRVSSDRRRSEWIVAISRFSSISDPTSGRALRSPTRDTIPRQIATVRADAARHLSGHSLQVKRSQQTCVLSKNTLQGSATHRTDRRQT